MNQITLSRFAYLPHVTLGWLCYAGKAWATLERPWLPTDDHFGGTLRESCIPDGTYELLHHTGPKFKNVWALVNPQLDVNLYPKEKGRSAILIHAGNRVRDVVGCVALGLRHGKLEGEEAVLSSMQAIIEFRAELGSKLPTVVIEPTKGTAVGAPWRRPDGR